MDVIQKLLTILEISQNEISLILNECIGCDSITMNQKISEVLLDRIYQNFDKYCNNLLIIQYLSSIKHEYRESTVNTRIYLLTVVSNYSYWDILPIEIIKNIQSISNSTLGIFNYEEYLSYIIAQMNIPPNHRRIVCLNLLRFPGTKEFVISILSDIIKLKFNLIDKFYCISLLYYIFTDNINRIQFNDQFIVNETNLFYGYCEANIITDPERNSEMNDDQKRILKELGAYVMMNEYEPVYYESKYGEVTKSQMGGISSYYKGAERFSVPANTADDVDLNMAVFVKSVYNRYIYYVRLDSYSQQFTFCNPRYSDQDYLCMIGIMTDNPELTFKYYNYNISNVILCKIGLFLLRNRIPNAENKILELLTNSKIGIDVRLMIAFSFKQFDDPKYKKEAYDILILESNRMTNTQKLKLKELIA